VSDACSTAPSKSTVRRRRFGGSTFWYLMGNYYLLRTLLTTTDKTAQWHRLIPVPRPRCKESLLNAAARPPHSPSNARKPLEPRKHHTYARNPSNPLAGMDSSLSRTNCDAISFHAFSLFFVAWTVSYCVLPLSGVAIVISRTPQRGQSMTAGYCWRESRGLAHW